MTDSTNVTCRSVCERLIRRDEIVTGAAQGIPEIFSNLIRDARLALAQPDGGADLRAQLDAANKRAEEAEAKLRELEESTPKLLKQWSENAQSHRRQLEFLAGWLLDRLVEGRAS